MSLQHILLATAIVVFGAVQYTLVVQAIRDLIRRPRVRGGNKVSWALLILCVPVLGALCYGWMGPTSFLRHNVAAKPAPAVDPILEYASDLRGPRPQNVTPLHPRPSTIRGRTPAHRPGLTRSRAHNTHTNSASRVRKTGS